MAITAATN